MQELGSTLILFRFDLKPLPDFIPVSKIELKPAPDFSLVVRNQHKTRALAHNSLCK